MKLIGWAGGIGYLCFWTGLAIADVTKEEGLSWTFPITIAVALACPFLLGLLAGEKE